MDDLNKMVRRHLSALTKAKKVGPAEVIAVCDIAFEDFDEFGWPDNWHTFNIARNDAEMEIARNNWSNRWI